MTGGRRVLANTYQWMSAFFDPIRFGHAVRGLPWFVRDYLRYRRSAASETLAIGEIQPSLHERTGLHDFDAHYFFVNAWASRRTAATAGHLHVDIGSQAVFATVMSAVRPVLFVDYRPLAVHLAGLTSLAGDLLRLPFRTDSVHSLSCLHVAEHVGLGRYGDPIDAAGTRKAAVELTRILAPGANFFFAVPIGRERVVFNAHRVHSAGTIRGYFPSLTLREFSGVDDHGSFREHIALDALDGNEYGCGLFWFTK